MIKLSKVSAGYNKKTILDNLSFSVNKSEFIAIIGPNGSGKSTLLKIFANQILPNTGTISLEGKTYREYSKKEYAARIAYFPQMRPIPDMNVLTLVSHGRFPHLGFGTVMDKMDAEIIKQAMTITNVIELKTRLISKLSGGERQRVFLAMLIAQDTDILLLDEPSTFLDIRYQIEIMDIMQKLNHQGKTLIFAAHDLPSALSYAKRVIVLENGKIVSDETPEILVKSGCIQQVFDVKIEKKESDMLYPYSLMSRDIALE